MINTGSRFWFGVVTLGVVGAVFYLLASGGELYGTLVLGFTAVAGTILGVASIALRDGDVALPSAAGNLTETQRPIATRFAAVWPALAALGVRHRCGHHPHRRSAGWVLLGPRSGPGRRRGMGP